MSNKTRKAYREIKYLIEGGHLRDGQPLTEAKAAELVGLGRGPVRESLLRLEAEGLLRNQGARRSRVVAYTEDQEPDEMLARYELREQIEGGAARLAAKNMTGWEIDQLRRLVEEMDAAGAAGDRKTRHEAATRFHQFLLSKCGNPMLLQAWEVFRLAPTRPRSEKLDAKISARVSQDGSELDSFTAVAEAIAAHDPDRAERLMKERIRAVTEAVRKIAMEQTDDGRLARLPDLG